MVHISEEVNKLVILQTSTIQTIIMFYLVLGIDRLHFFFHCCGFRLETILTFLLNWIQKQTLWAWVSHSATWYCCDSETRNRPQTYQAVVQKPSAAIIIPAPLWLQITTDAQIPKYDTKCPQETGTPKKALRRVPSPFMPFLKLSLSLASCSCSKLISPSLSCLLLGNGTWNDQHTFPLGGSDWFMWEQLCISCLVRWKEKWSKLMAQTRLRFHSIETGVCGARIHQGVSQSQSNNEEERRCVAWSLEGLGGGG